MKRLAKISMALLLCIVSLVTSVVAAKNWPDTTKDCSLTIEMKHGSRVLSGANVALYCVALSELPANVNDPNAWLKYVLTNEFAETKLNFHLMTTTQQNVAFAKTLAAYVKAKNISGADKATGSDGKATFTELKNGNKLKPGVYLVVHGSYRGYYDMDPYLVILPQVDPANKDAWVYSMEIKPKTEISPYPSSPPPPSSPTPTPSTTPTPTNTPTPSPSDEIEEVSPTPPPEEEPPPDEIDELPQTGVLRWPVPVFTILGIVLFVLGLIAFRRERRAHEK